uniref:Protein Wnt n=1 Tax=Isodiametra pulchra TaxID=504439 RepID=A0A2P1DVA6_ISOPU|nr:Wnt-8 protein [Isodiametra pulchra]
MSIAITQLLVILMCSLLGCAEGFAASANYYNTILQDTKRQSENEGVNHTWLTGMTERWVNKSMYECMHQLRHKPWNCPLGEHEAIMMRPNSTHHQHTLNAAFVQALNMASFVFTVHRECLAGRCDNMLLANFRDQVEKDTQSDALDRVDSYPAYSNLQLAFNFSQYYLGKVHDYLFIRPTHSPAESAMRAHNAKATSRFINKQRTQKCRCVGISGSCSKRSCYDEIPMGFRPLAADLVHRVLKVNERVELNPDTNLLVLPGSKRGEPSDHRFVYLNDDKDMCPFVLDRECADHRDLEYLFHEDNKHLSEDQKSSYAHRMTRDCKEMCGDCGYNYATQILEYSEDCNCEFHFCCEVKCERCQRKAQTYTCSVSEDAKKRPPKFKKLYNEMKRSGEKPETSGSHLSRNSIFYS